MKIYEKRCEACRSDAPTINPAEIQLLKPEIPDWELIEIDGVPRLRRRFNFKNFKFAMDFSQKIGIIAETEGHHPEIITGWGEVTVSWWSHKIKGLHVNDFIMAAKTDRVYLGNGITV